MNVVPFPPRPLVVISAGRVRETQVHTADGITVFIHIPPIRLFFVELKDADGEIQVWDGPDYSAALAAARECAKDGATIRDLTNEGAA